MVSSTEKGYKLIKELSYTLVKNNYACMHGGYSGGIMEAVADGAYKACKEDKKQQSIFNIGVPEVRFDEKWSRVKNAHFTKAAKDIFERLKTITQSDLFIVAPFGGDGTFLELDLIIHENIINEILNKPIKQIIFIEDQNMQWSNLFAARLDNLNISKRNKSDYPWAHFISFDDNSDNSMIILNILEIIKQM